MHIATTVLSCLSYKNYDLLSISSLKKEASHGLNTTPMDLNYVDTLYYNAVRCQGKKFHEVTDMTLQMMTFLCNELQLVNAIPTWMERKFKESGGG